MTEIPESWQNSAQNLAVNWEPRSETMSQGRHMLQQEFSRFLGQWKFGDGEEVCLFGEPVHDCEYGGVAFRHWETCYKIHDYVGPEAPGDR